MARSKLLVFFALILLMSLPAGLVQAQQPETVLGSGTAVISDSNSLGDSITYSMTGVTPPAVGMVYVGWLVSDDDSTKLNTGAMAVDIDGSISYSFTSPDGENFIDTYSKVVITSEQEANAAAAEPAGDAVFSHVVPLGAITHIRHLLVAWPEDTDKGILTNLKDQLGVAITHANQAGNATTLEDLRLYTHRVINIIEGVDGPNFDASFDNPGDGLGVLLHAQDRKHAGFAASTAPDDDVIADHAALVEDYGMNAETWAIQARDAALGVLDISSLTTAQTLLSTVTGPLDAALNGIEATGEGGASQAYVEAQLMATYTLATGAPPITPPVVGDPAIPVLAQMALVAALIFLGAGSIVLIRVRRSRANS